MKLAYSWLPLALLLAPGAWAATLSIEADQLDYVVGDTITLTIQGDPEGASDDGIFGRLLYDAALTATVSSSQQPLTTSFGNSTWSQFGLQTFDGAADVFNQSTLPADSPSNALVATLVLVLEGPTDELTFVWDTGGGGTSLDFFGLTDAPAYTLEFVPEPASAALLALGLAAVSASRRRRARREHLLAAREQVHGQGR